MCSFNIAVHTESLCDETGVITTNRKWLFCPPKKKEQKNWQNLNLSLQELRI